MDITMFSGFSDVLKSEGAEAACSLARELGCTSVEHLEIIGMGREPIIKNEENIRALKAAMEAYEEEV